MSAYLGPARAPIAGLLTHKCSGGAHDSCAGVRWTFTLGPVRCDCPCHRTSALQDERSAVFAAVVGDEFPGSAGGDAEAGEDRLDESLVADVGAVVSAGDDESERVFCGPDFDVRHLSTLIRAEDIS